MLFKNVRVVSVDQTPEGIETAESFNRFFAHVNNWIETDKEDNPERYKPKTKPPLLEEELEEAIGKSLEEKGVAVQHQVKCQSGIADIVTPSAVYEVKRELDTSSVFSAIGQVLIYRQEINPQAKAFVVGYKHASKFRTKQVESMKKSALALGVEVLFWDDKELI